ncbi:MAG: septal ring lytic transglycosylase RlpA family protein [Acidobacteriota bacterium]
MNELRKQVHRKLQGGRGRARKTVGMMAMALGLTATVMAAPPLKSATAQKTVASAKKWFQVGKASWYGKKFQGHRTADGEKYNMDALTCAHRTLPMGSWVRVTNLRNHRMVLVRVNDRGPVPETRILDLSYAAAKQLGIGGVAKVRVEAVAANDPQVVAELVNQVKMPLVKDAMLKDPMILAGQ